VPIQSGSFSGANILKNFLVKKTESTNTDTPTKRSALFGFHLKNHRFVQGANRMCAVRYTKSPEGIAFIGEMITGF
jgi:hypothetical protein